MSAEGGVGARPDRRTATLTLTTCNPKFSARSGSIVKARARPRARARSRRSRRRSRWSAGPSLDDALSGRGEPKLPTVWWGCSSLAVGGAVVAGLPPLPPVDDLVHRAWSRSRSCSSSSTTTSSACCPRTTERARSARQLRGTRGASRRTRRGPPGGRRSRTPPSSSCSISATAAASSAARVGDEVQRPLVALHAQRRERRRSRPRARGASATGVVGDLLHEARSARRLVDVDRPAGEQERHAPRPGPTRTASRWMLAGAEQDPELRRRDAELAVGRDDRGGRTRPRAACPRRARRR